MCIDGAYVKQCITYRRRRFGTIDHSKSLVRHLKYARLWFAIRSFSYLTYGLTQHGIAFVPHCLHRTHVSQKKPFSFHLGRRRIKIRVIDVYRVRGRKRALSSSTQVNTWKPVNTVLYYCIDVGKLHIFVESKQ